MKAAFEFSEPSGTFFLHKEPLYNEIKMRLIRWRMAEKTDFGILSLLSPSSKPAPTLPQHPVFPISRPQMFVQWKDVDGVAVKLSYVFILSFVVFRPQQSSARYLLQQHWLPVPQCCLRPLSQTLGLWDRWEPPLQLDLANQYFLWSPDVPLGVFVSAGKCISHFTNRKVPYCVKFNPDEDKQNLFVAGMSDKKIVQVKYVGFNLVRVNPLSTAAWNKSESHFQHGCV